jgi:hypothetical protein
MATRLDSTLSSNVFTAIAPRPDIAIGHGAKYWLQQVGQSIKDLFSKARVDAHPPRGIAPGTMQAIGSPHAGAGSGSVLRTLRCAETGQIHEQLPADRIDDIGAYHKLAQTSFLPENGSNPGGGEAGAQPVQDAFRTHVSVHDADGSSREIKVLPDSLLRSDLLNSRLGVPASLPQAMRQEAGTPPEGWMRGQVQGWSPNTLYDPLSGFAASISVRNGNEVVIGFSGMGSQRGGLAQGVRGLLNALGLTPPKNLAQASKLTQMVKAHIDQVNDQLPPEKQLKLTLAGFSMGGGLATYAALRNEVPAVVISPMRLGLLARAKCGREAIKKAPGLVTEVTVQGDWVADNGKTRALKTLSLPSYLLTGRKADPLGAIGHRYLVPKPSATERQIEAAMQNWPMQTIEELGQGINVHTEFKLCLDIHRKDLLAGQPPAAATDAGPVENVFGTAFETQRSDAQSVQTNRQSAFFGPPV